MADNIQYFSSVGGSGIDAVCNGKIIGQITYVRIGMDKLIIDYTSEIGYENALYFSRLFRKYVGMTPTQYRKKNRATKT